VILTKEPNKHLRNKDWIRLFGNVERDQLEDYGKVISLRVWYGNGIEVEYGLTDDTWADPPLDEGTQEVISAGMKVLFERGTVLSRHGNPKTSAGATGE
jgi:hypothetical protein